MPRAADGALVESWWLALSKALITGADSSFSTMIGMRSSTPPADSLVAQARELVDATLTALLRTDITDEQEHAAAETFLGTCTPEFLTALGGPIEAADGRLGSVVEAMTAAADHFRAGLVPDARSELVAARGALIALNPVPAPAATAEICDVCERESPSWALPVQGSTVLLMGMGTAEPAMLLVCSGCLQLVQQSTSDEELAQRTGRDVLPRSLRGLRARLCGQPSAWPCQAE